MEMVGSSTVALASTAGRCDELMRQQSALSEQLHASEQQRQQQQVLLQQNREGLVSAAAAVAAMKRALAELQDAVPEVMHQLPLTH